MAICPEKTNKTESRGRHIRQQSPTFPAITRLRFSLAPRSHKGFGFPCTIETADAKGLQKPESIHQR